MLPFAHFGMLAIDEVFALRKMRILRHVLAIGASSRRDSGRLQSRHDIRDFALRRPLTDYRFECIFILLRAASVANRESFASSGLPIALASRAHSASSAHTIETH